MDKLIFTLNNTALTQQTSFILDREYTLLVRPNRKADDVIAVINGKPFHMMKEGNDFELPLCKNVAFVGVNKFYVIVKKHYEDEIRTDTVTIDLKKIVPYDFSHLEMIYKKLNQLNNTLLERGSHDNKDK